MTLTTLKEEARAELENHPAIKAANSAMTLQSIRAGNSGFQGPYLPEWLDSIIDRTYHATKEEVRGMVKGLDSGMATVSNEAAYELCKQDILAALEDTTTSPTN